MKKVLILILLEVRLLDEFTFNPSESGRGVLILILLEVHCISLGKSGQMGETSRGAFVILYFLKKQIQHNPYESPKIRPKSIYRRKLNCSFTVSLKQRILKFVVPHNEISHSTLLLSG
ncbi:hypothetical protein GCM10027190_24960 [Spirosoma areae]